jgi:protein-disulfide isomerase
MNMRFALLSFYLLMGVSVAVGLAVMGLPTSQQIAQQRDFNQKVRHYLVSQPEVLAEAAEVYNRRNSQQQVSQRQQTLASFKRVIRGARGLPVWGNPKGDVTVVEFFDYRCPYCKRSLEGLSQLVKDDPNLRVVFKEYPILGPQSVFASKVAIASKTQGKYLDMHVALMAHRGQFDKKSVMAIARGQGLDVERLQADMKKPGVNAIIGEARQIGQRLALSGTPAFVIGDEVVPGFADLVTMKKLVLQARKRCQTC